MNANELAEDLEGAKLVILRLNDMLLQQQAEIEALKAGKIRAYDNGVEDGRKPNTHPVKELTDEEILDLCPPNHSDMMNEAYTIEFARAILRKAQEK